MAEDKLSFPRSVYRELSGRRTVLISDPIHDLLREEAYKRGHGTSIRSLVEDAVYTQYSEHPEAFEDEQSDNPRAGNNGDPVPDRRIT